MPEYIISLDGHSEGNESLRTIVNNTVDLLESVTLNINARGFKFLRKLANSRLMDFDQNTISNDLIYGDKNHIHILLSFYIESDELQSIEFNEETLKTVETFIKIIDWNEERFPEINAKLFAMANLSNTLKDKESKLGHTMYLDLLKRVKTSTELTILNALDNYYLWYREQEKKELLITKEEGNEEGKQLYIDLLKELKGI